MAMTNIPGYVQGFVFSDASTAFYDAGVFKDQAGYGSTNDLTITTGTPSFVNVGSTRGLTLDNTVQGRFLPAIPWEGTMIMVMQPAMSVNGNIYPVIFGVTAAISSNGKLLIIRASSADYRHGFSSPSSSLTPTNTYTASPQSGVKVGAWAISQETRKSYVSKDGVLVTESAAFSAASTSGIELSGKDTTRTDGIWARFGNLSGVLGDVAPTTNKMVICALHCFKGNALADSRLSAIAAEMATLKLQVGE